MNQCYIFHLVILFEEKELRLSSAIDYSFTSLFQIQDSQSGSARFTFPLAFNPLHIGNRKFRELTVKYFNLNVNQVEMTESAPKNQDSLEFYSGNPLVETTEGIIHVYKNTKEFQSVENGITSTMLCIFSVPSCMTIKDLLGFVAPMRGSIEELKVVQSGSSSHYMALLKFRSQEDTDQFYRTFNNTRFGNLDSEICQLMYVSHVNRTHPSKGTAFPIKDLLELPSCPVCLERLDEPVQGILTTILCNHTFHDGCIARVEDTTCPVCRYVQSPELLDDSQCADCCIRDRLWICLICGRIGCGRYGRKHAYRHFEESGHTFALELGKNLVWDYADDAYVHRLALNQEDGKVVQLGTASETGDKKLDMIGMEFSAVLTSQLESQRTYYEEQVAQVSCQSALRIQDAETKIQELTKDMKNVQDRLNELVKEKGVCSRKLQQATSLAHRLQKELEEERELNKRLLENENLWRGKAERAELDARQAQEQYKELLLNLEFRSKLEEIASSEQITTDEIASSNISIQQQSSSHRRRRKR